MSTSRFCPPKTYLAGSSLLLLLVALKNRFDFQLVAFASRRNSSLHVHEHPGIALRSCTCGCNRNWCLLARLGKASVFHDPITAFFQCSHLHFMEFAQQGTMTSLRTGIAKIKPR